MNFTNYLVNYNSFLKRFILFFFICSIHYLTSYLYSRIKVKQLTLLLSKWGKMKHLNIILNSKQKHEVDNL